MSDIKTILSTIDGAVSNLNNSAMKKQAPIYKELVAMLKKLDTKGDAITSNINNLKLINEVKVRLERLMVDGKYKDALKDFGKAFIDLQGLHNQYFASFAKLPAGAKNNLEVLKKTAIETTVNNLTEAGLQVGVTDGVRKILLNSITTGGSYADLTDKLRAYMGDDKTEGALARYVRTYATTSINQYSAEYNKAVADDLGLEWYMYTGSLLETSREFCKLAVEKKYIHVSEFPALLHGKFPGYGTVPLAPSTGLPEGLMDGTTPENFQRRRGGWNCGHQLIAVDSKTAVPDNVRKAVYSTADFYTWLNHKKNGTVATFTPAGKEAPPAPAPPAQPAFVPKKSTPKLITKTQPADTPKLPPATKKITAAEYDKLIGHSDYHASTYLNTTNDLGLEPMEAAVINAYTGTGYYYNRRLRENTLNEEDEVYGTLLATALQKLPDHPAETYRGVTDHSGSILRGIMEAFNEKKPISWPGFVSTSKKKERSFADFGAQPSKGKLAFIIQGKSGKYIRAISAIEREDEVLYNLYTRFAVRKIDLTTNVITLEEL